MRFTGDLTVALFLLTSMATAADSTKEVVTDIPSVQADFINVELSADGKLSGQVLDASGHGAAMVAVAVARGKDVEVIQTDERGGFSVPRSTGGLCVMRIDRQLYAVRTWKHGTAPPSSVSRIAIVIDDNETIRGNNYNNCPPQQRVRHLNSTQKYGLTVAALGGLAAYMALSRDNASE